ncbi:MAG: carboxypeptidase-like regulatory domain-containing protein [Bacteroidales bacterium]|nr:carboxypeptidase-like regulatory domain-containing protein [Bacteroidales bacterium]
MRLKALLIPILLLVSFFAIAQTDPQPLPFSVSGTVVDSETGKPLQYVGVTFSGLKYATVTNSDGVFTLKSAVEPESVNFTLLGYKTVSVMYPKNGEPVLVRMPRGNLTLEGAFIIADPYSVLERAISMIKDIYSKYPEMFDCFYRETVQKRHRFIYITEAVSRMYKTSYYRTGIYGDKVAVDKSRILVSPDKKDTLSVKIVGGPAQAVMLDIVKNDELLNAAELSNYELRMELPEMIGDRLQFCIRLIPRTVQPYPLYKGRIYIDRETFAFTRFELDYDMSDKIKATKYILISKPPGLRFTPTQVSIQYDYTLSPDGISRVSYVRSVIKFKCDWKKRLLRTDFTAVSELVTTDRRTGEIDLIPKKESFSSRDVLSDIAATDFDPEFWKDYNIIEPTESLDKAIGRIVRKTEGK